MIMRARSIYVQLNFKLCFLFQKHGPRMKCSSCNVIAHQSCINVLVDKVKFTCKPTFRDVGIRQYREQTTIQHHWVHRRSEKGKCKHCGKVHYNFNHFILFVNAFEIVPREYLRNTTLMIETREF